MIVEIKQGYWPNGQLFYETPYHENKPHGIAKQWDKDGQLIYERVYNHGQQHGVAKGWYSNGDIQWEKEYNYGKLVKETKYYKNKV